MEDRRKDYPQLMENSRNTRVDIAVIKNQIDNISERQTSHKLELKEDIESLREDLVPLRQLHGIVNTLREQVVSMQKWIKDFKDRKNMNLNTILQTLSLVISGCIVFYLSSLSKGY